MVANLHSGWHDSSRGTSPRVEHHADNAAACVLMWTTCVCIDTPQCNIYKACFSQGKWRAYLLFVFCVDANPTCTSAHRHTSTRSFWTHQGGNRSGDNHWLSSVSSSFFLSSFFFFLIRTVMDDMSSATNLTRHSHHPLCHLAHPSSKRISVRRWLISS
jgi:hypothetical protein